jgi:hypothetical protein
MYRRAYLTILKQLAVEPMIRAEIVLSSTVESEQNVFRQLCPWNDQVKVAHPGWSMGRPDNLEILVRIMQETYKDINNEGEYDLLIR